MKAEILKLLKTLGMHNAKFYKTSSVMPFNENVLEIFVGKQKIGLIGEIDLSITDKLIKKAAFGFEIYPEKISLFLKNPKIKKTSKFPQSSRDINIILDKSSSLRIRNSDIDYKITNPRLNLNVDRDKAYELGVTAAEIGTTIETLLASNKVTTFSKDGLTYNVILQAEENFRINKNNLDNIFIKSPTSNSLIPLSNLVTYDETSTSNSLKRINRMPSTIFSASLLPGYPLGDALEELTTLARNNLPSNASVSFTGASKEYFESGNSLLVTILFAILIVYLVLSAQFESFKNPLTIMFTVPIALTAGLYTLFLTGTSLNVYSQIGFLMLIGLIAKNGILVVEFANQLRNDGYSIDDAIIESSLTRLRPVLMTTISTLLGAIPLVLSSGAGAESRYSMAIVVFGGITLSALITLYLIPALYRFIESK